ncbi:MAG: 50S ribosomal protein L13 [Candidatus Nealsonbacteria bacterium]|nr:50S ribosomal protein L13 [Candidatus Nealsonbacteria bacterium]
MERQTHKIDASDKVLGRLASEVAVLLRGKGKPAFVPHKDVGDFVVIQNIDKLRVTGKKMEQKKYYRHSGYPGGLKSVTMGKIFERDPRELLKKTVSGMMPHNKLKKEQIKRLKFD